MNEELRELGGRDDRVYQDCVALVETEGKDDPKKLLRIQVRIIGLFDKVPVKDLPWAEVKLPVGCGSNSGQAIIAAIKKGHHVWVDFPYDGDTRRPRITGSVHHAPNGVLNLPAEAFAGDAAYEHKRTGEEPEQPAHNYGEDIALTLHGVMVCINKDSSYNLVQKKSGTEVTITADGDMIYHVEGKMYRSSTKGSEVNVTGDEKELIMGAQETIATNGITHDGGTGGAKGNVQGDCLCCYSGKPHPMISSNVKSTL